MYVCLRAHASRHTPSYNATTTLHVEYAERGTEYGILFICNLFCEYANLEYVRLHVIYRANQAEYGIHILVIVQQKYVNNYSTPRTTTYTTRTLTLTVAVDERAEVEIYTYIHIRIYRYIDI